MRWRMPFRFSPRALLLARAGPSVAGVARTAMDLTPPAVSNDLAGVRLTPTSFFQAAARGKFAGAVL